MHKCHYKFLFSTFEAYLQLQTPKFLFPISQLHSTSKTLQPNSNLDFVFNESDSLSSSIPRTQISQKSLKSNEHCGYSEPSSGYGSTILISHPWPEWVDLMELLLKRGYFQSNENPFVNGQLGTKEVNWIRTACLNFARDQFGLMRFLSRKDIHIIAGCGCLTIDRKVVNSGKRLRAHVGIDEGNVCSSCKLRGDCERAYVKAREDEGGRTVDVMRILLTYGLNSVSGTSENKLFLNNLVKQSVRRLLKEIVEHSNQQHECDRPNATLLQNDALREHSNVPMKQGDWLCPKCNFLNFARNIRCLRCDSLFQDRLKCLHEDQDHLPLKKGDWICEKCNFLNFAKNTRCLQCKEKPPRRQLNPGEWECESCNYINFRRNMVCLKCDHRRPKVLNSPEKASFKPELNNGIYPKNSRLRFEAANDKSKDGERSDQRRDAGVWRFVEEEKEDCQPSLQDKAFRFIDFPVTGGKSSLSQNEQRRERWRVEMLAKNKCATRSGQSEVQNDENDSQRISKYLEITDDEDMAEWFGHKIKNEPS